MDRSESWITNAGEGSHLNWGNTWVRKPSDDLLRGHVGGEKAGSIKQISGGRKTHKRRAAGRCELCLWGSTIKFIQYSSAGLHLKSGANQQGGPTRSKRSRFRRGQENYLQGSTFNGDKMEA